MMRKSQGNPCYKVNLMMMIKDMNINSFSNLIYENQKNSKANLELNWAERYKHHLYKEKQMHI